MSTNPFWDFAQFAAQICEEERQRDLSPARLRRPLGEMQARVNEREIQLQRHRATALAAGRKTGHKQREVERRVVALYDICVKLLLWEKDAPPLTAEERRLREWSGSWSSDPAGDYLIRLVNQFYPIWEQVNDLAAAYNGSQFASGEEPMRASSRYEHLGDELLRILDNKGTDPNVLQDPPRMRHQQEHDEAVACNVCELTGLDPLRWDRLTRIERLPWLEMAIAKAREEAIAAWPGRAPATASGQSAGTGADRGQGGAGPSEGDGARRGQGRKRKRGRRAKGDLETERGFYDDWKKSGLQLKDFARNRSIELNHAKAMTARERTRRNRQAGSRQQRTK
jgi:hypothetical protein